MNLLRATHRSRLPWRTSCVCGSIRVENKMTRGRDAPINIPHQSALYVQESSAKALPRARERLQYPYFVSQHLTRFDPPSANMLQTRSDSNKLEGVQESYVARGYAEVVPNFRQRLEDDHATKQIPERTVSAAAARRYSDLDARTTSSRPGYPSGRMVKREQSCELCGLLGKTPGPCRLSHGHVRGQRQVHGSRRLLSTRHHTVVPRLRDIHSA